MPNLTTLVLTNSESPAVTKTYSPVDIVKGVATFSTSEDVPLAQSNLTISKARISNGTKSRVQMRLSIPVVASSTQGDVTVSELRRTGYAEVRFTFDNKSTTAERENMVSQIADAVSQPGFLKAVLVDLESPY